MKTGEAVLTAAGGVLAGTLLGSQVLAPAPLDTPVAAVISGGDTLIRWKDHFKALGIPAQVLEVRGDQFFKPFEGPGGESLIQRTQGTTTWVLMVKKSQKEEAIGMLESAAQP